MRQEPALPRERVRRSDAVARVRSELRTLLERRRPEIEAALAARVYAIDDSEDTDPAYRAGLRESIVVALGFALDVIQRGEEHAPEVPPALRAQARMAARAGVPLETVLRRYFAGYNLLGEFLAQARQANPDLGVANLLPGKAAVFDRLLDAVSEEYAQEADCRVESSEQRRMRQIERLLGGEAIDTTGINYDFKGGHTAVVGEGPGAAATVRRWATSCGRPLLMVRPAHLVVWAWLGGSPLDPDCFAALGSSLGDESRVAVGEPAAEISGWRLSHRQAAIALPIALRAPTPVVRYAEVALSAAILHDDLLATSLQQIFISPLMDERDGGRTAIETLRAYFSAGRNAASAAAMLNVTRQAVYGRLAQIEARIGRSITSCGPELEVALAAADLTDGMARRT